MASLSEQVQKAKKNHQAHEQLSLKIDELEKEVRKAKERNKKQADSNIALRAKLDQEQVLRHS